MNKTSVGISHKLVFCNSESSMSFRAMVIIFLLKEAKCQMLLGITFLLKAFRCAPNIPVIISDFALGL